MNTKSLILGAILCAAAAAAPAQEPVTKTNTEVTTTQTGAQVTSATKTTTITGEVVRYEQGKTIVVRQPDSRVITYTLSPSLIVPSDVQIGRKVSIVTEPSDSGPVLVTRITTTSLTSDGNVKTTTEQTEVAPSGEEMKSEMTTVYGTVSAFEPGKSITLVRPDKTIVTYVVDAESQLPADLAAGKTVTVQTTTVTQGSSPVVRKVTYKKMKTKTKTVQP